jgi:hypothetical protein
MLANPLINLGEPDTYASSRQGGGSAEVYSAHLEAREEAMRKFKILGLTVFAVLAISAVAAASASAEYHIASPSGGTINGKQETTNEFFTKVGTVKCTNATFTGSQATETASTLTAHPEYSTCTLAGQKVTINTTGCNYVFQKPTTSPLSATVQVACGTGNIIIKDTAGLGCEVKVGTQGPLSSVGFTNQEGGTVLVTAGVTGISYSYTAGCPNSGGSAGSGTTGEYKGTVKVTGSAAISVT